MSIKYILAVEPLVSLGRHLPFLSSLAPAPQHRRQKLARVALLRRRDLFRRAGRDDRHSFFYYTSLRSLEFNRLFYCSRTAYKLFDRLSSQNSHNRTNECSNNGDSKLIHISSKERFGSRPRFKSNKRMTPKVNISDPQEPQE
jgi:hypothetical protein